MNISFHGATQMGEQERKEAAEERGNFVRMTRILLEGLSVCLRAQFLQAYEDAFSRPFTESLGNSFWSALPGKTQQVLNDHKPPPHVSEAQRKVRSGQVESWDNTILRAVLCYGPCSQPFQSTMGASPHAVLAPITESRNQLFAHAANVRLPEGVLNTQVTTLRPVLLGLFQRLRPNYRPFRDCHDFFSTILKGLVKMKS